MDHFIDLPNELIINIAYYLNINHINKCCRVNERFNKLLNEDDIWKKVFHSYMVVKYDVIKDIDFKNWMNINSYKDILQMAYKRYGSLCIHTDGGPLNIKFTWFD